MRRPRPLWYPVGVARLVHRKCAACGVDQPREEAPDPCLGYLPGVTNACCGHGYRAFAYVMFADWPAGEDCPRGDAAHLAQWELGGKPAPLTSDQRWHTRLMRIRKWVPVPPEEESGGTT